MLCKCDLAHTYSQCCGRYHAGEPAPSALALMRSRYAAYALGRLDYVYDTWHPSTRPGSVAVSPPSLVWTRLTIKDHHEVGDQAMVLFVAVSKENGRAQRMTERSRFVRAAGRWFYVDGEVS